ncbi:MAG TPA: glycosyltransferase [Devosiaceae bacterium]|nr:glycosyltransferase [Devosiaceae bacterium]
MRTTKIADRDDRTASAEAGLTPGVSLLSASETWYAHLLFLLCLVALALTIPASSIRSLWNINSGAFFSLGMIAVWRYCWVAVNYSRALYYRKFSFPSMRRRADAAVNGLEVAGEAPRAFLLVTSFRQDGDTSAMVYRAAFEAALRAPGRATVVASLVETGDQRLVTSMYRLICKEDSDVDLVIVRIAGTGKRDALAHGFRAIAKLNPDGGDLVAVIDGDSIVPVDLVQRCLGFFQLDPRIGALTTDEISRVRGSALFHIWYSLRFAQRNIIMGSNGQARRVLTLTGRMSMFRAEVACNPDFIRQVEADYIDHWRLGRIKFLTGDDKSTWFWLLKNNYRMLYLPDVMVATIEDPPGKHFVPAAAQLMTRWFGNMLRTNNRALALGPWRTGLFTWIAILDQRISMWTSLAGLGMVLIVGLLVTPSAFFAYAVWTLFTRYLLTLLLLTSRPRVSVFYPFFIYFNQIFGSIIKIYIFFRPNKQRWTRQKTRLQGHSGFAQRLRAASSTYMTGLAVVAFLTALACIVAQLPIPNAQVLRHLIALT